MRLVSQQNLANRLGVTDRTVRNMISRGDITGYKIPGVRAVRVDLDEVMSKVKAIPTVAARQEFIHGRPKFGGNVKMAPANAAVVVEAVDR